MDNLKNISSISLKKDFFYYLLPWGLGDSMIFCGLKDAMEKKLGGKILPVIKPSHELIMKMYGIKSYVVVSMNAVETDQHKMLCTLAKKCPEPERGKIYVAHPEFHNHFHYLMEELGNPSKDTKFLSWYKVFFGISLSEKLQLPLWYPEVSPDLEKRVKALTGLSCRDVIMVLPEANSANGISSDWWSKLLENLPQDKLLTNITHIENFPEFQKIPNIELSLEEVTALALHCRQVYAVRSGLCDLIFSKGSDLHVFYPTRNIYSVFGLYDMFAFPGIHETVYEADFDEYVHIGVLPQQKTKLGFGKWLFCSKIRRYSFFGINFFSMVEK